MNNPVSTDAEDQLHITTEAQFLALMEEVDQSLKDDRIPIPSRPLYAVLHVARLTKNENWTLSGKAVAGVYEGASLDGHIIHWFTTRYGDRLKVDRSRGIFPILIRGDLYLVRLPEEVTLQADQIVQAYPFTARAAARCDPLDFVVGLAAGLRKVLTDQERNYISEACVEALEQLEEWLKAWEMIAGRMPVAASEAARRANGWFADATHLDLRLSATLAAEGEYGLSRWHSLQASEKAIKTFICHRGREPSKIHDLNRLHLEALALGLQPLEQVDIDMVQCAPAVRYTGVGSNHINAYNASWAARSICTCIAIQLP
ncbi:HEPN domain-containing protein [Bradyrhizobium sp. F1.13.3]|uniref:HEPN domain-containing protein n=1 Tax=Bradyrhizobium sp. F1.13.3 TaxID=3156351 RepID=UPI003399E07C